MNQKTAVKRLQRLRRELDEVSEYVERLARDLDNTPTQPDLKLIGQAEAADLAGIQRATFAAYVNRGLTPDPVARLACGQIWLTRDIARWTKQRQARAA
jgi:hypothetical protein